MIKYKNDFKDITKRFGKSKQTTIGIINSAQILHMYNKNQISIQKYRNRKLELNLEEPVKDPERFIKEVIEPFSQIIKRKNLKVTIQNDIANKNTDLITDWKIYQIVLFNFIQNAVKYNLENGEIMINYTL